MNVGKLPAGVNVDAILENLTLEADERFLFACEGKDLKQAGVKGENAIFAFTSNAIHALNIRSLEVVNSQPREAILSVKFSLAMVNIFFTTQEWLIAGIDKADRKILESICEAAYPKLSTTELMKSKKNSAPEKQKHLDETYGDIVATAQFGLLKKVSLHSKGYVSGLGPRPEKLIAISGEANVTKKSGLGRGLGAAVTLPLTGFSFSNLDSSNMRGDVYITIVTDVKTHSIHIDMKNQVSGQNPVGEMQKLVTTGEALIKQNEAKSESVTTHTQASGDLAAQIRELNELFQQGVLSESEFNAAKARVLGN